MNAAYIKVARLKDRVRAPVTIDQVPTGNFAKLSGRSTSDVAKFFGISVRTLRFYEEQALLNPHRDGRERIYDATAIDTLDLILKAKRQGFDLAEIRALLAERGTRLASAVGGASTADIEQVTRMARVTFGTDEKAQQWLHRPTTALSDLSPMDTVFEGTSGIRKVVDLLHRIDHGLSS